MKLDIRSRLTVQFTLLVAFILFIFSLGIYTFSANYRKSEFYSRLETRTVSTARMLTEISEFRYDWEEIIENNTISALPEEKIWIFNPLNRLIYSSPDNDSLRISKDLLYDIRLNNQFRFKEGKYEAIGLVYTYSNYQYVIIVSALDKYGRSKLNFLILILSVGFVASIGITVLSGRVYAKHALNPISDIIREVDGISASNLHLRVNEGNRRDEIARLAITFNRMLARLESAFEMQKSFVSNASHELRTPLTSLTSQLEVSLMKSRKNQEYKAILESLLEDIRNLNYLSNGLLDLAKASSDITLITLQPIRMDEILWETSEELMGRKKEYHITIQFSEPIEDEKELTVQGNMQLLKTAMINLMENGCKYSPDKSVTITLLVKANHIMISFIDNGVGIDKEDLERIFEPFFRAKNVKGIPGSGLGLPLTYKIIQLHKGTFLIDSELNRGTTITVSLPSLST
jgi:two-component system, OmpR family, sensor histidine kinase ArlS